MPRLFAAALLAALAFPVASGAQSRAEVDTSDPYETLSYATGFEAARAFKADSAVFAYYDSVVFQEGYRAGLSGDSTRLTYLYGYQLGSRIGKDRTTGLKPDVFLAAFREALAFADMQIDEKTIQAAASLVRDSAIVRDLRERADADPAARTQLDAIASGARQADSLLTAAAQRPGAMRSASGLIVIEGTPGEGAEAVPTSTVMVRYTGTLPDGTEFDASGPTPTRFSLTGVVAGFTEGISGMREGGTRTLVIPPSLGYGLNGTPGGPIPANAALTFEVELVSIVPAAGAPNSSVLIQE